MQNASSNSTCRTSATTKETTSENINEAAAAIVRGINTSLIQDSYLDAAAFTTELSLKSEVPPPLRQHLNLLLKNQENISRAIEIVYQNCAQDQEVPGNSIIEGLSEEPVRLGKLGEILLTNHIDVLSVYRSSVLGRSAIKKNLLLVSPDFENKLYNSYGPDAQQQCRKEGDVFKKIRDGINNIGKTAQNISKSMAIWQTSDLKTESSQEASIRQKRENEMVPKLKKAGLLSDISEVNTRNQSNYTTPDHDTGISGFLQEVGTRASAMFEKVKNHYTFVPKIEEAKSTDDWIARYKNIQSLQTDVGKEVVEKYAKLMSQIGDAQESKDIYEGKLARIYIELETGKKFLEQYRKVAQKICQQGQTQNVPASWCVPSGQ